MKCKKCGCENNDNAKFCNECGEKLEVHIVNNVSKNNDDTTIIQEVIEKEDNDISKKTGRIRELKFNVIAIVYNLSIKKKIGAFILLIIILIGCSMSWEKYKNYKYETGYNLSYKEKESNLETQLMIGEYDKAKQLSSAYKVHENDIDKIIQKYKDKKSNNESKNKTLFLNDVENEIAKEEKQNACTVISQNINKNGNYYYGECEVKNNSKNTINYVRVEIYYYDKDYNEIDSDYTNSSTKISANATKKLEWMTKYDSRYAHCLATVSEFN